MYKEFYQEIRKSGNQERRILGRYLPKSWISWSGYWVLLIAALAHAIGSYGPQLRIRELFLVLKVIPVSFLSS